MIWLQKSKLTEQAEDKEGPRQLKKTKTFASHFSFIFIPLLTKTTDYVLGLFHQGKFAGSLLVKILLAHS